ncbi:MAG: Tex family protein [Gammaproteobacteria bacterium]|jgi:protein Tex
MNSIHRQIAEELGVRAQQVEAAVGLLDEGATVPFIARYRKEATQGLDDAQLRTLEERLGYLRELEARRATILESIDGQGKLTDALKAKLLAAATKTQLEDLYLPYKPKRRTKAQIAREAGLEPLALQLLDDPGLVPETLAERFVDTDKGVEDVKAALDGARQILMEHFSEDAELLEELRESLWSQARIRSRVIEGKEQEGAKFRDYFDYEEALARIPSHRALALFRGRNDGVLVVELDPGGEEGHKRFESRVARRFAIADKGRPADGWLLECVNWAWKVKLFSHLDLELKMRLRGAAEETAIGVFGDNLHDLLLAAPAGERAILGLDPGLRTGVKVAVVNRTGTVVDTATIYPHAPKRQWAQSLQTLAALAEKHRVALVAIGNGTASRETDRLAADLIRQHPELQLRKVMVSEAGASVYSASELASRELPGLDVSLRGAASIARRLQDPLAELVKIDPRSIGVGQYQHDVNQVRLARKLDAVVEDCVNAVGVDVNTASPALLSRVSGLSATQADNIVAFRDGHGKFPSRKALMQVPRLGDKTFEQSAGFLRIIGGDNPLDACAVHPEAYGVVERILEHLGKPLGAIIGNAGLLRTLDPKRFTDDTFGEPTVRDIIAELTKPWRDPRGDFRTASFTEGVEEIGDLEEGMVLEGTVTNVTNFGAFVDIGVHQDGLVHISALSHSFVKDPRDVVKTGDTVKVRVVEVDVPRKRIGLTMRLDEDVRGKPKPAANDARRADGGRKRSKQGARREHKPQGAMAAAMAQALKGK